MEKTELVLKHKYNEQYFRVILEARGDIDIIISDVENIINELLSSSDNLKKRKRIRGGEIECHKMFFFIQCTIHD